MSEIINVGEAKTQFSQLLDRACAVEEIVLFKAGNHYAGSYLGRNPNANWVSSTEVWTTDSSICRHLFS